ncbi:MAG: signal peptidase I [Candidatus Thermoplasmatota archaeon]|nr:signal peptidase I [Candidatus Thermoplasmatota archaeon]
MRFRLRPIVSYVSGAVPVLIITSYLLFYCSNTPYPVVMIDGSSMEPTLGEGAISIWLPAKIEDIEAGDIVAYRSYVYEGRIICHRVVEIRGEGAFRSLTTKGDANNYTDQGPAPHAPELPVTANNLLGKLVCFDGKPVKVPAALNPIFQLTNVKKALAEEPVFLVVAALAIPTVIGISIVFIKVSRRGRVEKVDTEELILGPEQVRAVKVYCYVLLMFLVFALISVRVFCSSQTVVVGVELGKEPSMQADISFGDMRAGETKVENFTFTNLAIIPTKCITLSRGKISNWLTIQKPVVALGGWKNGTYPITVSVPEGTKSGEYQGKLYTFFSPILLILPNSLIEPLAGTIGGIVILYVVASCVWSLILTFLLILGNKIIAKYTLRKEYSEFMKRLRFKPYKKRFEFKIPDFRRFLSASIEFSVYKPLLSAAVVQPLFVGFAFIIGYPLLGLLLSAFFAGFFTYLLGCRWRGGIIFSSIVSEAISLLIITILFSTRFPTLNPWLFAGAILFLLGIVFIAFLLLVIPVVFLGYSGGGLANWIRMKLNPSARIFADTDF